MDILSLHVCCPCIADPLKRLVHLAVNPQGPLIKRVIRIVILPFSLLLLLPFVIFGCCFEKRISPSSRSPMSSLPTPAPRASTPSPTAVRAHPGDTATRYTSAEKSKELTYKQMFITIFKKTVENCSVASKKHAFGSIQIVIGTKTTILKFMVRIDSNKKVVSFDPPDIAGYPKSFDVDTLERSFDAITRFTEFDARVLDQPTSTDKNIKFIAHTHFQQGEDLHNYRLQATVYAPIKTISDDYVWAEVRSCNEQIYDSDVFAGFRFSKQNGLPYKDEQQLIQEAILGAPVRPRIEESFAKLNDDIDSYNLVTGNNVPTAVYTPMS